MSASGPAPPSIAVPTGSSSSSIDLTQLTCAALRDLQARIADELGKREDDKPGIEELHDEAAAAGNAKRARQHLDKDPQKQPKLESGCEIVTLQSIDERLRFAQQHGFCFTPGDSESIEDELDCCGIPERYAEHPPSGWEPYSRQKPGIVFFPSDRDAVFVISERAFGSVPALC